MKGRIQTYYPWGSPKGEPEPKLWHHDLLQPDGTPYRPEEIEQIHEFCRDFNLPNRTGSSGARANSCAPFASGDKDYHATVPGRDVHRLPRHIAAAGTHAHRPD